MSPETDHSRRKVLALAGMTLGTTALAGCTGTAAEENSSGSDDDPDERSTAEILPDEEVDGLVTVEREDDVETVVDAITGAIEEHETLTLVTTVDHAENAASVGRSLPPTTLVLFGNPELGTQLMNERRTVGIDLPQKFLVFEDDGGTSVVYNDPEYLAERHDVTDQRVVIETVAGALDNLANAPAE